jgi:hypothetical protein
MMTTITDPLSFLAGYVGENEAAKRAIAMLNERIAAAEKRASDAWAATHMERERGDRWENAYQNMKAWAEKNGVDTESRPCSTGDQSDGLE